MFCMLGLQLAVHELQTVCMYHYRQNAERRAGCLYDILVNSLHIFDKARWFSREERQFSSGITPGLGKDIPIP